MTPTTKRLLSLYPVVIGLYVLVRLFDTGGEYVGMTTLDLPPFIWAGSAGIAVLLVTLICIVSARRRRESA